MEWRHDTASLLVPPISIFSRRLTVVSSVRTETSSPGDDWTNCRGKAPSSFASMDGSSFRRSKSRSDLRSAAPVFSMGRWDRGFSSARFDSMRTFCNEADGLGKARTEGSRTGATSGRTDATGSVKTVSDSDVTVSSSSSVRDDDDDDSSLEAEAEAEDADAGSFSSEEAESSSSSCTSEGTVSESDVSSAA